MMMRRRPVAWGAIVMGLFSLIALVLVGQVDRLTSSRIAANERQTLLASLGELIAPDSHDNDMLSDRINVTDPRLGSDRPLPVYRARKAGKVIAVALTVIAPEGYSGAIRLLVAVRTDGTLAGVRVLSHKETPGLGDWIEREKSDWLLGFDGRSLRSPAEPGWAVRKDGGVFDQFSGATITPRAVVAAVRDALRMVRDHRRDLFATDAD